MSDNAKTIALDIGGTRIKMAVVQDGVILRSAAIPAMSQGKLAERLPDIAQNLICLTDGDFSPYRGMGVAMPCLVDAKRCMATEIYGKFEDAPTLDIASWAMARFGLPVVMEQDSKAALLGEIHYGAAKGYRDALLIIMGTGVGTAVMIDGRLLDSRNHSAGALGSHIIIETNGRKCSCNSAGCLEAYTSGWALPGLIRAHKAYATSALASEPELDFLALERAVRGGDRVAQAVLDSVIASMRAGVISMIHAYDPEAVILCGGPLNMGALFTDPLLKDIDKCLWGKGGDVRFLSASHPDESVLLGLHYLAANHDVKGAEAYAL